MRLLTWNLFGLETDELDVRSEAAVLMALLGCTPEQALSVGPDVPPEVVFFQEVVDRSLAAHLRPHLQAGGYTLVTSSRDKRHYYELIAVRPPCTIVRSQVIGLDSLQGRELLEVEVDRLGQRIRLMTAHLESLPEGSERRLVQSRLIAQRLRSGGPAVFGGDTNLRAKEAASLDVQDAWELLGSPRASQMTYRSVRSGRRARYDQIWGHQVSFESLKTLGEQVVTPKGATASDHLGLRVDVLCDPDQDQR